MKCEFDASNFSHEPYQTGTEYYACANMPPGATVWSSFKGEVLQDGAGNRDHWWISLGLLQNGDIEAVATRDSPPIKDHNFSVTTRPMKIPLDGSVLVALRNVHSQINGDIADTYPKLPITASRGARLTVEAH